MIALGGRRGDVTVRRLLAACCQPLLSTCAGTASPASREGEPHARTRLPFNAAIVDRTRSGLKPQKESWAHSIETSSDSVRREECSKGWRGYFVRWRTAM